MKRYFSIVFVCVFLFPPTGYADDITIPYKTGDGRDGIYTGEVLDGLPNGHGKFVWRSFPSTVERYRTEYVGEWENGSQDGHGATTYLTLDNQDQLLSTAKHVGLYKDGIKHGQGTFDYSDGSKVIGEFQNDGVFSGVMYDKEGSIVTTIVSFRSGTYVGEEVDGIPNGYGTFTTIEKKFDGFEYVGEFKDGAFHGQGTYTDSNGEKYVGEYKEGLKHGQGTWIGSRGDKFVGEWKEEKEEKVGGQLNFDSLFQGQGAYIFPGGAKDGQGAMTWKDGSKYVGYWEDGRAHGQGVWYWPMSDHFPSGMTQKGEFKEGRLWNGVEEVIGDMFCHLSGIFRKGKRRLPTCTINYDRGKYVGEVNQLNQPHGHGVLEYPDGFKYVGEWKHDMATGYGSIKFSDGATYVGDVYDGEPHGHGTFTYADGSQYIGEWKEFKEHGYGVFTRADDGRVFSGEWTEGEYCPKCKRDWDNAHAAGQRGDYREVIRLLLTYAESGDMFAQGMVGVSYRELGQQSEAAKWYLKAAEQGSALAQYSLGLMYGRGEGVELNHTVAIKLFEQALLQKLGMAAKVLSVIYYEGRGVPRDRSVSYAYLSIAAALGLEQAKYLFDLEDEYNRVLGKSFYSDYAIAQGQVIAREIWGKIEAYGFDRSGAGPDGSTEETISTGSGFFINDLGFVVTNSHVVNGCDEIHTVLNDEKVTSFIVINDVKNDLAVLKTGVEPASIAYFRSGQGIRAGEDILAFGYPLQSVLSDDLKGTKGMVNALSGMNNDTRMMQISAPVQPGNSGGPLLDQAGNIVGVVTAKMDAIVMAQLTDDIAQNVNFALKASLVRDMLEVKEIDYETASSKEEQNTADIFEQANKFTVLIECHH